MDLLGLIALAAGVGWASGLRIYLVALLLGIVARFHWLAMPRGASIFAEPWALGFAALLASFEFVADKVRRFDSKWENVRAVARGVGGGVLAGWVVSAEGDPMLTATAGVLGFFLAVGTHAVKAMIRTSIHASSEPAHPSSLNVIVSSVEEALVLGAFALVLLQPTLFLSALGLFVVASSAVVFRLYLRADEG